MGKVIILPGNDVASGEDAFGLESCISGLAGFIRDCAPPMTIAIQGSWGSGKTSLMNMVRRRLEDSAICVDFNTWQYSQFSLGEQLPVVFYESLIEKLSEGRAGQTSPEVKRLAEFCKRAAKTAVRLGASFAGLEGQLAILAEGAKKEEATLNVVKTVEGLQQGFQELVEERCKEEPNKDRVVFFVDDMDRLPPQRAVELMEVLKVVMESGKCVFVLAIDYDVVVRGVRAKYGADMTDAKGRSFFDKLIQVPFTLPVSQYQLQDYIRGLFYGIPDKKGEGLFASSRELSYAVDFVSLTVGNNPRSIKRLFNTFTLGLYISQSRELSPAVQELLFAVECLQMGFESVYKYLRRVCGDSDELVTALRWFTDRDLAQEETVDWAVEHDPELAEELALDRYTPAERARLERFMGLFKSFLPALGNAPLLLGAQADLMRWEAEDWFRESAYTVSAGKGELCLWEWEILQDAFELSAATSLGDTVSRRRSKVPEQSAEAVMDNLRVGWNWVEDREDLSQGERYHAVRQYAADAMTKGGVPLRESAVAAFYTRDLGRWSTDEGFFRALAEVEDGKELLTP